jgi:hypothetical protein
VSGVDGEDISSVGEWEKHQHSFIPARECFFSCSPQCCLKKGKEEEEEGEREEVGCLKRSANKPKTTKNQQATTNGFATIGAWYNLGGMQLRTAVGLRLGARWCLDL